MDKLTEQLAGSWKIKVTNFPMWLSGKRRNPSITYDLLKNEPLIFSDVVAYQTEQGKTKRIEGTDTQNAAGFEWRGNGLLKLLKSQWTVVYLEDHLLVIRFKKSLVTPAGVDILVREEAVSEEVLKELPDKPEKFGLTMKEYETLIWL